MANSSSYAVGLDGDVSGFINALDRAISKYKTLDKTIKDNENVSTKSKKVIVDNNNTISKSTESVEKVNTKSKNKIKENNNEQVKSTETLKNKLAQDFTNIKDSHNVLSNNYLNKVKSMTNSDSSLKSSVSSLSKSVLSNNSSQINSGKELVNSYTDTTKKLLDSNASKLKSLTDYKNNTTYDYDMLKNSHSVLSNAYKVNATNMLNQDTNLKNTINSNTRAILGDNNSKLGSNDKLKINFSDSTKSILNGYSQQLEKSKSLKDVIVANASIQSQKVKEFGNNVSESYKYAKTNTESLSSKTASLTSQVAKLAIAGIGLNGFKDLVVTALGKVDTLNATEKAITALTGDAKLGAKAMQDISNAVQGTPVGVQDLTGAVKGFTAAGGDLKIVPEMLQATLDAAYGVGNGKESIDYISNAFKGLQASGVASLEDINRMVDQNIPAIKILANTYGLSVADMKKTISEGSISSTDAIKALIKGIEEGTDGVAGKTTAMAGQVQNASNTIQGASSNIKAALVNTVSGAINQYNDQIVNTLNNLKEYMKSHQQDWIVMIKTIIDNVVTFSKAFFDETMSIIKIGIEWFNAMKPLFNFVAKIFGEDDNNKIETFARLMARAVAVMLTINTVKSVKNTLDSLISPLNFMSNFALNMLGKQEQYKGFFGIIKLGISSLGTGLKALYGVMMANPILAVVSLIAILVTAFITLYKTNENFRNGVNKAWENIVETFKKVVNWIKDWFSKNWYTVVLTAILGPFGFVISQVIKYWDNITSIFKKGWEYIKGIGDWFGGLFGNSNSKSLNVNTNNTTRNINQDEKPTFRTMSLLRTPTVDSNKDINNISANIPSAKLSEREDNNKKQSKDKQVIINFNGDIDSKETADYIINKVKKELIDDMKKDNRELGII